MQFVLKPYYAKHSRIARWAVYIVARTTDELRFLRSFYCEEKAREFIGELKEKISQGDYSYLTLRS